MEFSKRTVVGEMEGINGQYGAYDIVTFQAELNYSPTSEIVYARIGCEGRVGEGGEVMEKF